MTTDKSRKFEEVTHSWSTKEKCNTYDTKTSSTYIVLESVDFGCEENNFWKGLNQR